MSRRILSAFLALALVAGFAAVTKADVTGSFDISIALAPEGNQTEAVEFFFDIQSNLVVNVTLSGLTIGADIGFGTTGIEFAVLSLNTSLGALQVSDTFVFASPFGCTTFPTFGQCDGQNVFPMGGSDATNEFTNAVGFVKKRIELELNIAGITINNLALFEDVDFPDIQALNPSTGALDHEHDHFTVPGTLYYLDVVNSTVDDQTPTFGFGDVITLSGQTVSGITVTGQTALCASVRNYIKKRNWAWEVNKACSATLGGSITTPIEGGAKTPLLFEQETLSIEGVEIGGVNIDVEVDFTPLSPISTSITASFDVLDLASVSVFLSSSNITNVSLDLIQTVIVTGNIVLILLDTNGDLDIDLTIARFSIVLNPNQNPANLNIELRTGNNGITRAQFTLGISRGILSLSSTTRFSGTGSLAWSFTTFALSVNYGNGFAVEANMAFSPAGMGTVGLNLGLTF